MSHPWTAPTQMPAKHFSKASRTIALWRSSRSTTREKSGARPSDTTSPGKTAQSALSQIRRAPYELRSICARSSAIEPNLTVPSGSLASIEPSV
jgi:hypothetical protein